MFDHLAAIGLPMGWLQRKARSWEWSCGRRYNI